MVVSGDDVNVAATAADNLEKINSASKAAAELTNYLTSSLEKNGITLNATGEEARKSSVKFGLLSTVLVGVRKDFENLNGIDTKSLNTFRNQIEDIGKTIKDSPISTAKKMMEGLSNTLINLGAPIQGVKKALEAGTDAFIEYAMRVADSADNGLKAQNVFIQLAGKTGNLGNVYAAAGVQLENINSLLLQQADYLTKTGTATNIPREAVQQYYVALGTIPGALSENVKSTSSASDSFNMLTAAMKLAKGAGRDTADVIDDMKIAFKDYNLVGENALVFSARMTELNNKFGASFDVVRESLRGIAGEFKMYGDQSEGVAKILNNYVGGLKATGLSGDVAIETVTNMTKAIGGLSLAQKSFLSAQSGGAGGLMGAYKIEDMMRKGQTSEVMDMVMKQIQKLSGGKMVTVEEASQSQTAAARLTKQTGLLQMFGFGKGGEAESHRILEGLRAKQEGRGETAELKQGFTRDTMDRGTQLQETAQTDLSIINSAIDGGRMKVDVTNFGTFEKLFTARMGTNEILTKSQTEHQLSLRQISDAAAREGGAGAANYRDAIRGLAPPEPIVTEQISKILEATKRAEKIPIKDPLAQIFGSRERENLDKEKASLRDDITSSLKPEYQQPVNVRSAAQTAANIKPMQTGELNEGVANPRTLQNATDTSGVITVNVTGYCLKCKQEIEGSQQASSVNPVGVRL